MRNILSLTEEQVREIITSWGYPDYQALNLFKWLYTKRVKDFFSMTDLPKALREKLSRRFSIEYPEVVRVEEGSDGTKKYLLSLEDGETVEAVWIPEKGHTTFCLSTQVGCRMGCKFCATGTMGLRRNLGFWEILGQVLRLMETTEGRVNIVLMGMGEPLDNWENVSRAIEILKKWMGFSPRRITLSTVGLLPLLWDALRRFPNLRIAISLNFPDNERRSRFMPVNRKYPVEEIIKTIKGLPVSRRDRITIEYVLMKGINDSQEDAEALAALLRGLKVKINLIPYNENENFPWKRPSAERVERFASVLRRKHYSVFVRYSKGNEIKAACGQLRTSWGKGTQP